MTGIEVEGWLWRPPIAISGLHKTVHVGFRRQRVDILNGVDLTVGPNDVFGLLGPERRRQDHHGQVRPGADAPDGGRRWRWASPGSGASGYLPENPYFYDYLSGREFLGMCARLFALHGDERRRRVDDLLAEVGLEAAADTHLRKYSKGMLQRIGIAQALVNDPELVLLDEPMTGLDPVGRVEVKRIIQELHERGKTVLFNSHILSDVHELCSRIAIMREGRVVWQGTVAEALDEVADARGLLHQGGDGVNQLVAIAVNTFKETIRDRILGVIVVFALIMIAGGLWLGSISLGAAGPHDEGLRARRGHPVRPHRGGVRRREPGAQGGGEAHRVRALLQAGEPRRLHRPASSSGSAAPWPSCWPAWAPSSSSIVLIIDRSPSWMVLAGRR